MFANHGRAKVRKMKELFAGIDTKAGTMPTFVVHPQQHGPFPAVILYMDFWGAREELYDIARWVATVGYCCVVPDLYYRQGTVLNEIHDRLGRMVSLDRLDEATRAKVLAPLEQLSDAEAMADTDAVLQFLAHSRSVRAGAKGCFGYCLGGRLALRAGGRFPDQFKACASLHGTRLVADGTDSPHLIAGKLQGEFYCGFGANDPFTPPATITQLAAAMNSGAVQYSYVVHTGAEHGYALPNRDVNKMAALRDWEQILAMFNRQLTPYRN
jgi:carboxymethylenebutenolidase